ncbi:class I SAM-dependent methyltransferase [Candidatus Fermentibacterales bacterium]|nr:class I SAM-dependent methyltransferase [Candidatus Fermentibacterales bacterium]
MKTPPPGGEAGASYRAWEGIWTSKLEELDKRGARGRPVTGLGRWMAGHGDLQRLVVQELRRAGLADGSRARVLEVGCGSGDILGLLDRRGIEAVGCDICVSAARVCRRLGRTAAAADASWLPFRDGEFDVSYASGVLDQMEDPDIRGVVLEMRRVTRPGGIMLVVSTSRRCRLHEWTRKRLERLGRWPYGRKRALGSLLPLLESCLRDCRLEERERGLLIQLHFIGYLFARRPALVRLLHGLSLVMNWSLWPLNRLPGTVLVDTAVLPRSPEPDRPQS